MDTDSSEDGEGPTAPAIRIPLGHRPVLFALPGSDELATQALAYLGWQRGKCNFSLFKNGEVSAKVEESVTSHDVFVLCVRDDRVGEPNRAIMQLLLFLAALRGESPYRITVILPCLDYSRQDRRLVAGEAIPPRLLLRCMKTAGADRFLTADLHNEAEVAFAPSNTVFDELSCTMYLADFIRSNVPGFDPDKTVVCATNGGGMTETRHMAGELRTGFMMADRMRPQGGGKGKVKIIASRSDHAEAIIVVDDMFDTCGTLVEVCKALHDFAPASKIYGLATHGYFSGEAAVRIKELVDTCNVEWVAVTNSVAQTATTERFSAMGLEGRLKVVDISRLLAGAAMRIHLGASVNLPKFRSIGPGEHDPLLQTSSGRDLHLARQTSS